MRRRFQRTRAGGKSLDADIQHTMGRCEALSECGEAADRAAGTLVMPAITKAAVVLGGSYGEGGLVEGGKTTDYYQPGRHVDRTAARLPGAGGRYDVHDAQRC